MKQLKGISHNINETIIGKITTLDRFLSIKKDMIYVGNKLPSGYKAVISIVKVQETKLPVITECNDACSLQDGDIVTISSDGLINVIHEMNAVHNAIFVTERCNSNCIMCPQPPVKEEEDRTPINLKHVELLPKGLKSIGLTGGEPTLLGDKFFDIIRAINKKHPMTEVNILSNGVRFANMEFANKFANTITSNTVVDIPIYSDVDDIHNEIVGTKTFHQTIKGIYNLAKLNVKIGIRIVVHKKNYNRLPELSEFIYHNFPFIYQIAFMQMEYMGKARENIDDLWIDPVDYNSQMEEAVKKIYYRGLHVSIYNAQLCVLPKSLRRFAVRSISDWKNIYLKKCDGCDYIGKCPGFFESSRDIYSKAINPIKNIQTESV